ncbi:dolichyl-diphosphooligosaccharide--protein glycosyltransferase subunit 1-like [Tubulanus polymorphus]|uniref:dolichyl-diphosphooligosaccharide--protein glycosyltransferase subunit 1-like n=1 Tax=Tubulanus polymorphus TaxID=672921 RepID=UPI003DA63F63
MGRITMYAVLLLTILGTACIANKDSINGDLVNAKVQTTIDLSTHLVKIVNSITLQNNGKTAVRSFLFMVDPAFSDRLSFIGAVTKVDDEDQRLTVVETTVKSQSGRFWRVDLASKVGASKTVVVDVETVFSHTLKPYPSEIRQSEKQLVRFDGALYFYSPYATTTQSTTVKLSSPNVESYTKTKPVSFSENTITYGPYENKPANTKADLVIHYENNTPFLTTTTLTRVLEVSHWGNIAVEETYDMYHSGAKLKGSFSRYDYQRNQDGVSSIKSFKTILPASARDVYYRDEIGNISTSNLKEMVDQVELELQPRFPLFGGWKTHYLIGYNVPSYEYLFTRGDSYALKMRFVDHIYDDMLIDKFTLKIILPEGAKNVDFGANFDFTRGEDQLHYTYLDTVGRPVITVHKTNLVEQHIQDFTLKYTYQKFLLLQEPLLVVGAFYLLFFCIIIYVRLDFSITKDEASESRMRVASLIEQVQSTQDKRSALYQSYADAINKYKASKDSSSFHSNRKKIDGDHKNLSQQIAQLQSKLKVDSAELADKVNELQKLDQQFRDQVNLGITYAEKLVAGKMNKSQYIEYEATNETKKDDVLQKMETILLAL